MYLFVPLFLTEIFLIFFATSFLGDSDITKNDKHNLCDILYRSKIDFFVFSVLT